MQKLRVLVVDDSPTFLKAAAAVLMDVAGIEIVGLASSGAEALDLAALTAPDLVLTDLVMPAMDGLELTRRLVQAPNPPMVAIMTSQTQPQYRSAAALAGATEFVPKADLTLELPAILQRLLENIAMQ